MKWDSIFFVCVFVYLIISIPVYLIDWQYREECYTACNRYDSDIVVQAHWIGLKEPQCRCFDSDVRREIYIPLAVLEK